MESKGSVIFCVSHDFGFPFCLISQDCFYFDFLELLNIIFWIADFVKAYDPG